MTGPRTGRTPDICCYKRCSARATHAWYREAKGPAALCSNHLGESRRRMIAQYHAKRRKREQLQRQPRSSGRRMEFA